METADVAVPVRAACNPWTQFESFPEFMPGVKSVTQLTDSINRWVTKIGPVERAFHTKVVEQHPDQRIARRSVDVKPHAGGITFAPLDALNTKVTTCVERTRNPSRKKPGRVLPLVICRSKPTCASSRTSSNPGKPKPEPDAAKSRTAPSFKHRMGRETGARP